MKLSQYVCEKTGRNYDPPEKRRESIKKSIIMEGYRGERIRDGCDERTKLDAEMTRFTEVL